MSDDKPTKRTPPSAPTALEALKDMDWSATSRDMEFIQRALARSVISHPGGHGLIADGAGAATGAGEVPAEGQGVEPQSAGTKPKQKRSRQGKQLIHGADRTVRLYKITEAEIDRLGELSKDEKTAWTRMAFCFGLAVNVALGLLFQVGVGSGTRGAALALGVLAAVAACRFWRDALNKRSDGQSALDKIKGDHDFADV